MTIESDAIADDPAGVDAPPPPGPWRRRFAIAGTVLLVAGLVGAGTTLGWYLRGWLPGGGVGEKTIVVERPLEIEASTVAAGTVPNVLGLDADEAMQAYADAGADPRNIDVRSAPFVAAPGSVIEQTPTAAAKLPTGAARMELRVAEPATMPELKGLTADAARAKLTEIGAGATTVVRFEPDVEPGQVATSEPAAGAPATPNTTIVVSEEGSSVALADLESVSSDCRIGDAAQAGATTSQALLCDLSGGVATTEYAINDKVGAFEAELGIADGGPAKANAKLVVKVDGKEVATYSTSGRPETVKARVPGGASLTLELSGDPGVTAVLAEPLIVGARSGIDELAKP